VGYQSGYSTTTGAQNTYIGRVSGFYNLTSNYNTFIGDTAGYSTTGGFNTFVGGTAGYVVTGSKNTILGMYTGNQSGLDIRTLSNYIVLSDGDGNPRAWWGSNGAGIFPGSLSTNGSYNGGAYKIGNTPAINSWYTLLTIDSSVDKSVWIALKIMAIENGAASHWTVYGTAVVRHNGSPYSDFSNLIAVCDAPMQTASSSSYLSFQLTNNGVTNGTLYLQAKNTTYVNSFYIYEANIIGSVSWAI
jgi:hypothetical protein